MKYVFILGKNKYTHTKKECNLFLEITWGNNKLLNLNQVLQYLFIVTIALKLCRVLKTFYQSGKRMVLVSKNKKIRTKRRTIYLQTYNIKWKLFTSGSF